MLNFSPSKVLGIILAALLVCLGAVPVFFPEATMRILPQWMPRRIGLGPDLQSGSFLLFALDESYVRKQRLEQIRDSARSALNEIRVPHTRVIRGDAVEIRVREPKDAAKALPVLRAIARPFGGFFGFNTQRDIDVRDMGDGSFRLTIPEAVMEERLRRTIEQSITIVEKRVNVSGTVEHIQYQGSDRILVKLADMTDPTRLKELLGRTAQLEFRMIDTTVSAEQAQTSGAPAGSEVLPSIKPDKPSFVVKTEVLVAGRDLVDVQPGTNIRTDEPIIDFRFNSVGRQRFARATTENVGMPFAIVLDGKVVSAPVIREPITGGQGQISGNFTVEEAEDLAILLRAGTLPAPLIEVEERIVDPGLGKEPATNASKDGSKDASK